MLPAYAGMIREAPREHRMGEVLPAYAGMIPAGWLRRRPYIGAPRVCGDDPIFLHHHEIISWCSPRMRG